MKATLEFNLPEDQPEFNNAIKGGNWKNVCWDIDQYLRKHIKYDESLSEEQLRVYEGIREELYSFMIENKVDLYEVE
jgi:hypothetical protein